MFLAYGGDKELIINGYVDASFDIDSDNSKSQTVTRFNMTEMFSKEDFTMVKNPGKENMEIITKEGQEIKRYTPSEEQETSGKRGKKVGVAYQLESGEIIYVPE